jgi:NADPH2:quinone reductase
MKAIQFSEYGSYDMLRVVDLDLPELKEGQLLIKVTFAAINPVDNTIRKGLIKHANKLPMILGNEGAGVVIKGNNEFPDGTRVIISCFTSEGTVRGILSNGTWQEYLALYPEEIMKTPENVPDQEAAAFPVGFLSAYACLHKADFTMGKSVLSLAAGGAVGNAAAQLSKALGASLVITTAGSALKSAAARSAGFEHVIDLTQETITDAVLRITEGKGVDIVIDSIGGHLTGQALSSMSRNGILVGIGYSAGTQFTANMTDFVWKGIQMRGQSLSGWSNPEEHKQALNQLLPLLSEGRIKPVVAKLFVAAEIAEAQRFLIEDRPFGKVLIQF